jgi:integrase
MDVVAEQRAAAAKKTSTLGDLVPKYLDSRKGDLRQRSHAEAERYLKRTWKPLHSQLIDAITRQNIVTIIDELPHKVAADRARMALSGLYGWAIERGVCDANPTMNIKARAQNGSRTRVLTEAELAEVWKGCLDDDHGRIVRLLILTGQRRAEIGDLAWPEADLDNRQIELPELRTKNGRPHIVPLSAMALAILKDTPRTEERDLVFGIGAGGFSGWSKAKAELDARIAAGRKKAGTKPMTPWVLHDLRRSFVTHISERGFAQSHVIEALVNHISGAMANSSDHRNGLRPAGPPSTHHYEQDGSAPNPAKNGAANGHAAPGAFQAGPRPKRSSTQGLPADRTGDKRPLGAIGAAWEVASDMFFTSKLRP